MSVQYQPVECKSFLHHFNKKFLPFNWGANPYRGCEHSCPYCFARYTHEYLGYDSDTEFDNKILVKVNAADVLDKELSRPGWKHEAVNPGSVCDPYQPAEKKFRITQQVLEVFAIMPIFPYLTDDFENINGVVKAVSDVGAKDMIPGVLDLRAACRNRVLSLIKEEFPDLLPKYLALYKTAYAPTDYTGRIYWIVETAQRRCGFKKLEMPVFTEKQTKLKGWIKKDEDQA